MTVRAIVAEDVRAALAPVTDSEYEPGTTPDPTAMATVDDLVAGLVPKAPVIPEGQPETVSVTAELNPFAGVTVTVDVPFAPAIAVALVAPSVNPGEGAGAVPATVMVPNCCQVPAL